MVFDLTGLESREWLTIAVFLTAVLVAVRGAFPVGPAGRRLFVLPVITAVGLIVLLAAALLLRPVLLSRVLNPVPLLVTLAITVVLFAVVDLLFGRVLRVMVSVLERIGATQSAALRAAMVLILAPVIIASSVLVWRMSWGRPAVVVQTAPSVASVETYELTGSPMDVAMQDATVGFASFGQGSIIRFEFPEAGGTLRVRTVADGLEYPRGLAIIGDQLFVAELTSLPCAPGFPLCKGGQVANDPVEGERTILASARGRISAYAISADGALGERTTLVEGLPVADTEHAVNDLAGGPDGDLYVSVGWPNAQRFAEIDTSVTPHPDWMGSILRIDPATGAVEVRTRGLRNVYGIAFDDRGDLWGVDNDGPARNGWRTEEVVRMDPGADLGFPDDGTYGPWSRRTVGATWTLDAVGSAGLAWAGTAGGESGLFTGNCGRVDHLALPDHDGTYRVIDAEGAKPEVDLVLEVDGCVTSIAGVVPRTLVIGLFGYERGSLVRVRLAENS